MSIWSNHSETSYAQLECLWPCKKLTLQLQWFEAMMRFMHVNDNSYIPTIKYYQTSQLQVIKSAQYCHVSTVRAMER